jgi:hypothetical protein
MKRTLALLAFAGALVAAVAAELPELRRYLKIRMM